MPTGELPLNINRETERTQHGVTQAACTDCGNCCGGCNVGAKNTLTTNYLPCAKDHGASIFTQMEVRYLEKLPDLGAGHPRWLVHYTRHGKNAAGLPTSQDGVVTANRVHLGAGSAGNTAILMRSEREGALPLSGALGTRVSANGDLLGAVYNTRRATGIVPFRDTAGKAKPGLPIVGQTISVYADFRKYNESRPLAEQFVMLDAVVPRPFVPEAARLLSLTPAAVAQGLVSLTAARQLRRDAMLGGYPPADGALNHSMVLLVCGHDTSGGRYVLDGDNLHVKWPGVLQEDSFRAITTEMERYAARLGGVFIANPRGKLQATHPLGGAPMGDTEATGVVNHRGQVFNPSTGGIHEGLYVVDAAAIPRSLAAPPLLTITALAERVMRYIRADGEGCRPLLEGTAASAPSGGV
jgi:cholesterol oxidase